MTTEPHRDLELLEGYLAGDHDAFDELVRRHQDRVLGVCLRMLRDREAALDATQETFLTLFRKADRFKAEAAFTTWLYRVTVNTCYDQLRRNKRRSADPLPENHDPEDAGAQDAYHSAEVRPEIEAALQQLSPEFRAAVILVDLEGLSLEMAGDLLGIPVGTVKSRVFRGRKRLAEILGNLSAPAGHPTDD